MAENIKLSIKGPNDETRIIEGNFQIVPHNPEKVYQELSQKPDPFKDFFILKDRDTRVSYVFASQANHFSLAGRKISDFKINLPTGEAQIHQIIDNTVDKKGKIKISDVTVHFGKEKLLYHEQDTKEEIEAFLKEKLKDKRTNERGIQNVFDLVQPFINATTILTDSLFRQGPDGAYHLHITVVGAPLAIEMGDLPKKIQNEAKKIVTEKMNEYFRQHPYINGACLVDTEVCTPESIRELTLRGHKADNILAWRYPGNTPTEPRSESWNKILRFIAQAPPLGLASPLKPNRRMAIPNHIIKELKKWLRERIKVEQGRFDISLMPTKEPGLWKFKIKKRDYHVKISQEQVEELKQETGVDLTDELKALQKGTQSWSGINKEQFLQKIEQKYRAKGLEFMTGLPEIFKSHDGGETLWLQLGVYRPLIHKKDVSVTSVDSKLSGFPPLSDLRELLFLGKKDASHGEFFEGYQRIKEAITKADYLVANAYPYNPDSGFPIVNTSKDDNDLTLTLPVARYGDLKILTDQFIPIPQASLDALRESLEWQKGTPVRPQAFFDRLQKALIGLNLGLEDMQFQYTSPTDLDFKLKVIRPQGQARVGVSVDMMTGEVQGNLGAQVPHLVPGTSTIGGQLSAGKESQSFSFNVESLPFTDGGTRIRAGIQLSNFSSSKYPDYKFKSAGLVSTLLIPLGDEGVASSLHLMIPLRSRYSYNKQGSNHLFAGTGIGISYKEFVFDGLLKVEAGQDVDRDFLHQTTDTTTTINASYEKPLDVWDLILEANLNLFHRHVVEGKGMPPVRLIEDIPMPLDFSQEAERSLQDTNATASLLLKKKFEYVSPFVGMSCSNIREIDSVKNLSGSHKQRCAAGLGLEVPFMGAKFYAGWEFFDGRRGFHAPDPVPVLGIQFSWAW